MTRPLRRFTPQDQTILRAWWPHLPARALAVLLGRTEGVIRQTAHYYGLQKTQPGKQITRARYGAGWRWTPLEDAFL